MIVIDNKVDFAVEEKTTFAFSSPLGIGNRVAFVTIKFILTLAAFIAKLISIGPDIS